MKNYTAVLNFEKKGVSLEFADFPGCALVGNNANWVKENAPSTLAEHVWRMRSSGHYIPDPAPYWKVVSDNTDAHGFFSVVID